MIDNTREEFKRIDLKQILHAREDGLVLLKEKVISVLP
jgi:hypothetical protein